MQASRQIKPATGQKMLDSKRLARYNMRFTTKWAGFHRPFFLGVCFYRLI
jgi:hypothetical protein